MNVSDLYCQYSDVNRESKAIQSRAAKVLPGGNTRTANFYKPYPAFVASGNGKEITTHDGDVLVDFLNNYTQAVLGHAPSRVVEAVSDRLREGNGLAAPTVEMVDLAELIVSRVSSIEKVRFCNSGTEATMNAVRAAIAYTENDTVIKAKGGYHGTHDTAEVGVSKDGRENKGIPLSVESRVVSVPYNDTEKLVDAVNAHGSESACILLEPILGAGGMIPGSEEFLSTARELASANDLVLIFDEVMSFRLAEGGAQQLYDIEPDLTTLGKIIGGGLPVGAFGGKSEIMDVFHPERGEISHSGTFNGNPATMVGGIETLKILDRSAIAEINWLGEKLRAGLREVSAESELPVTVTGQGSVFQIHFTDQAVVDASTSTSNKAEMEGLYHLMRANGFFMAPRGMGNVSTPMDTDDIRAFVDAFSNSLETISMAQANDE